jgi:hypothetical protein
MHEDTAAADMDLLAAIGRIVVEAAMLEYSVASLIAASEGLQGVEREERARAITASTGMAMRLFEKLAEGRDDLRPLCRDTKGLLQARHFVAHSVYQQDAVAEGRAALFILHPRTGETMITMTQAQDNARMIREGRTRIAAVTTAVDSGIPYQQAEAGADYKISGRRPVGSG